MLFMPISGPFWVILGLFQAHFRPTFGAWFWGISAHFRPISGSIPGILGYPSLFGAHFGAFQPRLGAFWVRFRPSLGPFWAISGHSGPVSFGGIWANFGPISGTFAGILELFQAHLGTFRGILTHLRPISGPFRTVLADFGSLSKPLDLFWAHFGPILGHFGQFWACSDAHFRTLWGVLAHFGPILGHFRPILGPETGLKF